MKIYTYVTALFFSLIILGISCHSNTEGETSSSVTAQQIQEALDSFSKTPMDNSILLNILQLADKNRRAATDTLAAEACRRLGNSMLDSNKNVEARDYFRRGLSFAMPTLGKTHLLVLRLYHNLGVSYRQDDDIQKAIVCFDSVSLLQPQVPFLTLKFINSFRKAAAYAQTGEFYFAENFFQEAYGVLKQTTIPKERFAEMCLNYSDFYRHIKAYQSAIKIAQQGIDTLLTQSQRTIVETDRLAGCYLNISNALKDSGAYVSAAVYALQALQFYKDINSTDIMILTSRNLGELYRRAHKSRQAEQVLTDAMPLAESLPPSVQKTDHLIKLHINRGEARFDQAKYAAALSDYDSALVRLVPNFRPNTEGSLPTLSSAVTNRSLLLMTLSDVALARVAQQKAGQNPKGLQQAAAVYDTLARLLGQIRANYLSNDAKMNLSGESRPMLEKAVSVCLELYRTSPNHDATFLQKAFSFSEYGKSAALLESVRQNAQRNLSEGLRTRKEFLQKERADIETKMQFARNDAPQMQTLQDQWQRNLSAFQSLQQDIRTADKNTDGLAALLSLETIQQHVLGQNQAIIEYFVSETTDSLYIFLLKKNDLKLAVVPFTVAERADVATFVSALANVGSGVGRDALICQKGYALYQKLLAPVAADLPERLVIVAEDPLSILPFETLLRQPQTDGNLAKAVDNQSLVIFHHAISYSYSANLLDEMQSKTSNPNAARTVAAFAPPFAKNLETGEQYLPAPIAESLKDLKPLQNAVEIAAVGRFAAVESFNDNRATKENFLAACQRHSVVHVATHGILNHADANYNFISFAQNRDTLQKDQLFYLKDLYANPLPLDLVVLSACETTRGANVKGEGNLSMARGLASAGVKSFITTLWSVRTDKTAQLTPLFYQSLNATTPKDVALTEAKRHFIAASTDNFDPNFWAGLILMGDAQPILLDKEMPSAWWKWLGGSAVAGLLLLVFFRRKKKG